MNTLVMQGYLRSALGASAELAQHIADRIWDQPPAKPTFPYLTIGIVDGLENFVSGCCIDWEVTGQVHVWSRENGYPQGKLIAELCDRALDERYPTFPGHRMGYFERVTQVWLRDPDGLTSHGVLEYRAHYGPQ